MFGYNDTSSKTGRISVDIPSAHIHTSLHGNETRTTTTTTPWSASSSSLPAQTAPAGRKSSFLDVRDLPQYLHTLPKSGLEADQKVAAAHGCYAMTATTALTAQNTTGVFDVHHVPPAFLRRQIDACVGDIGVDVVKTGMLASAETIAAVADAVGELGLGGLVVDPVMVATSGSRLLPTEALKVLRERLLPRATVLTPNLPEAVLLLEDAGLGGREVGSLGDLEEIARAVRGLGPEWVLVKGGHCPLRRDGVVARTGEEREVVVDVLYGGPEERLIRFETPYHDSKNTHGTGCSLACELGDLLEGMVDAD